MRRDREEPGVSRIWHPEEVHRLLPLASLLSCAVISACGSGTATSETSSSSTGGSSESATEASSSSTSNSGDAEGSTTSSSETSSSPETSSSSGTAAETSDTTSTAACEGECLEIPRGWQGPALVQRGKTATACEGDFDVELAQANRGLVASPASCGCECGDAAGMGCSDIQTFRYDFHDTFFCPGIPTTFGNGTLCEDVFGGAGPGGLMQLDVEDGFAPPGSCDPIEEIELEAVAWDEVVTLCGGLASTGSCEQPNEQCTPGEPGLQKCVFQAGAADCNTAGPFIVQQDDAFTEFTDDRSCTQCACTQPTGGCQIESVEFFDGFCSPINSLGEVSVNADDACLEVPDVNIEQFRVTQMLLPPAGSVTCDATGGTPSGAALPQDPITICCLPPVAQ